jgi:hypothetical protein
MELQNRVADQHPDAHKKACNSKIEEKNKI